MAISYNAGTNIITITGYTEAVPCNFTDIYNADVAGGWGVVTKQGTSQYLFTAIVYIGDDSTATWFLGINSQILTSLTSGVFIYCLNNANCNFGEIVSVGSKLTKNGCSIYMPSGVYVQGKIGSSNFNIYDSIIDGILKHQFGNIWNVTAKEINYLDNANCYNILLRNSSYNSVFNPAVSCVFDIIKIHSSVYGLSVSGTGYNYTISDSQISNTSNSNINVSFFGYDAISNLYLINFICDWTLSYTFSTYGKIHRQYEVDLKVIDKDNVPINTATVKIWDKDSNLVVDTTTNASGVITTQTITRGHYNQANGSTLQEASPHLIKIEKAGYTTYEADFTLEEKTDWLIAIQAAAGGLMRNPPMAGGMV